MQVDKPKWYLKKYCPDCLQGYPSFYICPNCNFVTVVCETTRDAFINPKNLEQGFTEICSKCTIIKTKNFILANSKDILNAGFTIQDFE